MKTKTYIILVVTLILSVTELTASSVKNDQVQLNVDLEWHLLKESENVVLYSAVDANGLVHIQVVNTGTSNANVHIIIDGSNGTIQSENENSAYQEFSAKLNPGMKKQFSLKETMNTLSDCIIEIKVN